MLASKLLIAVGSTILLSSCAPLATRIASGFAGHSGALGMAQLEQCVLDGARKAGRAESEITPAEKSELERECRAKMSRFARVPYVNHAPASIPLQSQVMPGQYNRWTGAVQPSGQSVYVSPRR